ncbi:MAG: hypothetical protein J3K34DRAFT_517958 [Monoraphidium minutum]|nr:MAG: hypothetical protein J3K34DRAFT_517958 [Monoraphidium minutum]
MSSSPPKGSFEGALKSSLVVVATEPSRAGALDGLPHDLVACIFRSVHADALAAAGATTPGPLRDTLWEETKGHEGAARVAWEALPPPLAAPPPRAPPAPPLPPPALSRLPLLRQLWRLQPGALAAHYAAPAPAGALACCGPTWGEARQARVVDVFVELQSRGLSAADAARALDSGLTLRLCLWVAAAAGGGGGGGAPRSGGSTPRGGGSSPRGGAPPGGGASAAAAGPAAAPPPPPSRVADFAYGLQLDDGRNERFSFESHVRCASSYQYYSGRRQLDEGAGWLRCDHVVSPCPRGFRRASVLLRGRGALGTAAGAGGGGGGAVVGGALPTVRFGSVELSFAPAYEP